MTSAPSWTCFNTALKLRATSVSDMCNGPITSIIDWQPSLRRFLRAGKYICLNRLHLIRLQYLLERRHAQGRTLAAQDDILELLVSFFGGVAQIRKRTRDSIQPVTPRTMRIKKLASLLQFGGRGVHGNSGRRWTC